ncbi:MAG: cytochrome ubiquinol oxidase subunit I, partial [Candidatus Heimdallarchaeota archaeon]|nr:cytochrome ubiquinol oxidase subunit I [Candidatus Heimdallarchaeota archaeon]
MDTLVLARLQFAATIIYHFFFVPLTLGLGILVAIMQTKYYRTGDVKYKRMTKFWGKLFVINFAMGVVTGIVQEFQFGMNWSEYSRYVGDIFGAPLALEALMAFFLESTFLGIWIFGWDRLPKKIHLAAIWMVAIGANISALWILVANAFMQHPVGYIINEATGRAEMVDFFALLKNPTVWTHFPHTIAAGLTTGAFFVMGISVYHLMKNNEVEIFSKSFRIAAIAGLIGILGIVLSGHQQAQHMVQDQPMKMAAAEALWEAEDPASFSLITLFDSTGRAETFSIRIPYVLSLLSYNSLEGEVLGVNDLQKIYEEEYGAGDYVPEVPLIYWSFRIMVFAGTAMGLLIALGFWLTRKNEFRMKKFIGKLFIVSISLPFIANTFGWIMTEMGRMPWVVFGLLKVEDAVSPNVDSTTLLISLIGFVMIYGVLMVADVSLLNKYA